MPIAQGTDQLGPPQPRICGRCRRAFSGDASLAQDIDSGWWACPPCKDVLIGAGALVIPSWAAKAVR